MWLSELTNLTRLQCSTFSWDVNWEMGAGSSMQSCTPLAALTGLVECSISNMFLVPHSPAQLDITTLTRLTSLATSNCSMAGAVSSQMLQTSSQLVSLVVNDSAIVSLPDSLSALVCLTELDVTNSRLTSIPQAVWFLPKIKILKADRNKINSLEAVSASAHPHLAPLEVLDLSYNIRLKELPGIITHLVTLTRLDVSFNQLTGLPGEAHLRDTRVLSQTLGTNSSTWGLDAPRFKLQELQCGCNRLEHVPAVVRTFTQLRSLGLARTRLKHVPDWLWSLSTLQQLDLRFNSIKQLPEIPEGTMTQLARLNVSANLLSELPASIGRLCNLTDLEAELNYIQVWAVMVQLFVAALCVMWQVGGGVLCTADHACSGFTTQHAVDYSEFIRGSQQHEQLLHCLLWEAD